MSRIEEADRAVLVALADSAVLGFVDAALQRHEDRGTRTRARTTHPASTPYHAAVAP